MPWRLRALRDYQGVVASSVGLVSEGALVGVALAVEVSVVDGEASAISGQISLMAPFSGLVATQL